MTDAPPILKVTGLRKSCGRTEALRSLSFEVYPGELVGLLGPNGAGKSTLFQIGAGLFAPDGGSMNIQCGAAQRPAPE